MTNAFNLNNRTRNSRFASTLRDLSDLLSDKIDLVKEPRIMVSHGSPQAPKLNMRGAYFQGKPISFSQSFTKDRSFIFYIIANSFKQRFSSHALVGYWNGTKLKIFDPNGDIDSMNSESVYQGVGYRIADNPSNINNPLYKTLFSHYRKRAIRVEFYRGPPISCPVSVPNSCAYRALLYIVARARFGDSDERVYQYTEELVPKIRNLKTNPLDILKFI